MGYVSQASSSLNDASSCSLSVWVRIPAASWASSSNRIFCGQWGHAKVTNDLRQPSYVWVVPLPTVDDGGPGSIIQVAGTNRSGQYSHDFGGIIGNLPCLAEYSWTSDVISTSFIDQGKWFLLQVSMDWSVGTYTSGDPSIGTGIGTVLVVLNGVTLVPASKGSLVNGNSSANSFPIANWSNFSQPFDMPFEALPFGLPAVYPDYITWPVAEYQHFQFWSGQALDFSNPEVQSKFFTVSGGTATPASTISSANAFGQQDYLFTGKASNGSFFVNRGTAGTTTVSGGASDFTPGPSF